MKTAFFIFLFCLYFVTSFAQMDSSFVPVVYRYSDGTVSSEGFLREGKPDGYWKSFYENGKLKSEGNRKNYELDSTWKFYNSDGVLSAEINYREGIKNGIRRTYQKSEIIEDYFVNDVRENFSKIYYTDGKLKRIVPVSNGLENGMAFEFDRDSVIIMMAEYRKGFLLSREYINRKDAKGLKQGLWKTFYDNGKVKEEVTYLNDKKNGYFKKYDETGTLISIEKYINDQAVEFAEELKEYEIRRDYHDNGKVKIEGSYFNNKPDGIRREFDSNGVITSGYIFSKGILMGEGIFDAMGKKQGPWKEYHESGELAAKGSYKNNMRVGKWVFYHRNGKIEQEGTFNSKGIPDGEWKYYYESGNLLKAETLVNGENDDTYTEYSDSGVVIVQGQYAEGFESGEWIYTIGDIIEKGTYTDGVQTGWWIQQNKSDGKIVFKGEFRDGKPEGKHIWYYPNGNKKSEGFYSDGIREGDWRFFSEDGSLSLIITYRQGIEIKYNSVTIKPEIDPINND